MKPSTWCFSYAAAAVFFGFLTPHPEFKFVAGLLGFFALLALEICRAIEEPPQ